MTEDRKTGDGEAITDQTKVTLQLAIALVAGALALAGVWFKMEGSVGYLELKTTARIDAIEAKDNARMDKLEERTDRQVVLLCAIAKKLNVESGECR